jgi:hypothetical protein
MDELRERKVYKRTVEGAACWKKLVSPPMLPAYCFPGETSEAEHSRRSSAGSQVFSGCAVGRQLLGAVPGVGCTFVAQREGE